MKPGRVHPAAQGAPRSEQHALRGLPVVPPQLGRVDRLHAVGDIDHPRGTDERVER